MPDPRTPCSLRSTEWLAPWCPIPARAHEREAVVPITTDQLALGEQYDRPFLAGLWGYKDWHAIGRGVVTPSGEKVIVLFVTREKQEALPQYEDNFEGDRLNMEGEDNHANDARLVNTERDGDDIHLFYREKHHQPFTYLGDVHLLRYEIQTAAPS